ncbi:MAG: FG-GAP-like repeat-containing protein [Myxococcota bacterium]
MQGGERRRRRFAVYLACAVFAAATSAVADGQLQIVAHEDDDLYFMTPAVPDGLATGRPSWTVFLTAGDAGRTDGHWQSRELGIRAAYAAMMGALDLWTAAPVDVGGRLIPAFTLDGAPHVRVVFLRLPDGNPGGTGYGVTGNESLRYLWEGSIATISSVDGADTYTRAELIATLDAIVRAFDPDVLRIQDMTAYHGSDHSDHFHAGRFGFEAHLASGNRHRLRAYRAYNIDGQPVNLSAGEIAESNAIITTYGVFDPGVGPTGWNQREIPLADVDGTHAVLIPMAGSESGRCLEVGDAGGPGETIGFAACADVAAQSFLLTERDLRHGDHCLVSPARSGSPGSVGFAPCGVGAGQTWTFFTDGHIRGPGGLCVVPTGGALGLEPCDGGSRIWEVAALPGFAAGSGTAFSAAAFGTDPSRYRSLSFGDLDADGRDDVCARTAVGIDCARAIGDGRFEPAQPWHPDFGDDDSWEPPEHGTTLRLADIDGDGRADVCGRGNLGVYCARSSGLDFFDFRLWTSTFSDADGGTAPQTWGSLQLGDIDGDGDADLCGHRAGAVHCLRSNGVTFEAAVAWETSAWEAALGLPAAQAGRTMMLGDVDGDGAADLCERGAGGVWCALADPAANRFRDRAMRSQGEYADALGWSGAEGYWGTLRLGDFSGDGQADLCGRGGAGVLCLYSMDGRFSAPNHLLTDAYGDAAGFLPVERATTFRMADVDGDGRADLCASGATALECAVLEDASAAPEPGVGLGLALGGLALAAGGSIAGRSRARAPLRARGASAGPASAALR